jgi:hypothetical protein
VSFTGSVCGEQHEGEVRDIRLTLPDPVFRLDEDERARRAWVGEDSSVLREPDGDRHFVRGLLELPIRGEDGYFGYGSWVEVSAGDFADLGELWHEPDGWRHEPFPGVLANELAPYTSTVGLPLRLRLRDVRLLPLIELEAGDHPLVRDQAEGITDHDAHGLAAVVA